VDVRLDRADRRFHDQLDAHGGGEVHDRGAAVEHLGEEGLVGDGVDRVVELRVRLEMGDVVDRPGGQVVEHEDLVAAVEQRLGEVRSHDPRTAGNEHTHRIGQLLTCAGP